MVVDTIHPCSNLPSFFSVKSYHLWIKAPIIILRKCSFYFYFFRYINSEQWAIYSVILCCNLIHSLNYTKKYSIYHHSLPPTSFPNHYKEWIGIFAFLKKKFLSLLSIHFIIYPCFTKPMLCVVSHARFSLHSFYIFCLGLFCCLIVT